MSHEAIVFGIIVGPLIKPKDRKEGVDPRRPQMLNEVAIRSLPSDDDWPWIDKSIFSLPGPNPEGTFRCQVIHFGFSIKDDPNNYSKGEADYQKFWDTLINKFEGVLRSLYWSSVRLYFESDFEQRKEITWQASESAWERMGSDPPQPVTDWTRSERIIPGKKVAGT